MCFWSVDCSRVNLGIYMVVCSYRTRKVGGKVRWCISDGRVVGEGSSRSCRYAVGFMKVDIDRCWNHMWIFYRIELGDG